jgi:rubrerythrin
MNPMTRANLEAALAGEALTALRFGCFARVASAEGLPDVARLFDRIASEELSSHATALVAVLGICGDTRQNLVRAIERETSKHQRRYAEYAADAARVGDSEAAALFERLAGDENRHATWLRDTLEALLGDGACGCQETGDAPLSH